MSKGDLLTAPLQSLFFLEASTQTNFLSLYIFRTAMSEKRKLQTQTEKKADAAHECAKAKIPWTRFIPKVNMDHIPSPPGDIKFDVEISLKIFEQNADLLILLMDNYNSSYPSHFPVSTLIVCEHVKQECTFHFSILECCSGKVAAVFSNAINAYIVDETGRIHFVLPRKFQFNSLLPFLANVLFDAELKESTATSFTMKPNAVNVFKLSQSAEKKLTHWASDIIVFNNLTLDVGNLLKSDDEIKLILGLAINSGLPFHEVLSDLPSCATCGEVMFAYHNLDVHLKAQSSLHAKLPWLSQVRTSRSLHKQIDADRFKWILWSSLSRVLSGGIPSLFSMSHPKAERHSAAFLCQALYCLSSRLKVQNEHPVITVGRLSAFEFSLSVRMLFTMLKVDE